MLPKPLNNTRFSQTEGSSIFQFACRLSFGSCIPKCVFSVPGTARDTGDTAAPTVGSGKIGVGGEEAENRQNKRNVFRDDHDID